ncbi:orotate phosphoribosyltransferase [Helicobacter sp. 13S00401-1]|uniref:molybdopterin-dependent oxidoreductase n=1 Tax=Helicobacter sp. 13S00401-1 TaxID=1905758 RepID=UPI000BA63029|nr:molybdopterin-dependent oxidoreductase [Helicobacter sp. 13S00401-1]PAF51473.1 orotate phosphoribosyltransferase [Helicobacter sp. 13S00401-1]
MKSDIKKDKRRGFLKTIALGAVSTPLFAKDTDSNPKDDYRPQGSPHIPEFSYKNGKLTKTPGQDVILEMCHGCVTKCGIRVRLDHGKVVRCVGNPYHPLANVHHQDYKTPLVKAFSRLASQDTQEMRATVCSRGALLSKMAESKVRILSPLKRVGKRGEGKWQKISFEQLLEEVVEGGNLFGEGQVDGIRSLFSDELIDKDNPDYGTKRNQLLSFYFYDGRSEIVDRFIKQSFGTINHYSHGGICGGGFRIGSKMALNSKGFLHTKPDYENARFNLFWGTAPSNAGNPFQKQAKMLATARSNKDYSYAVIDPSVNNSVKYAASNGKWIAIKSGTDLALAMAMIRWIIENKRYATNYLIQPNLAQAKLAGEIHHSNATHLVIVEKNHPKYGQFARVNEEILVCSQSGKIQSHLINEPAKLEFKGKILLDGKKVAVKSSFLLLKESAFERSLKEYSKLCGVSLKDIIWLSDNFSKNGRKVNASVHGGMMSTLAGMTTFSILTLNTLMGTYGYKGGTIAAQVGTHNFLSGRYELGKVEGGKKPSGLNLSRSGKYYETSTEYKRKLKAGLNPYPATQPWYPISMPLINEPLSAAGFGYPYNIKVFINYMTNVVYNQAGSQESVVNVLKDTKKVPLFIGIDAFMNETNAYSDYIVPDGVNLENWALPLAPWGVLTKTSTIRYPALKARQDKDKNGESICVEHFYISVAKKLGLKGFGKNAFKDKDGKFYDLDKKEQFYARALANLAFDGKGVDDISKEDLELAPVQDALKAIESYLLPEELKKVATILSRGGRFEDTSTAYENDIIARPFSQATPAAIYYEPLGAHKHSITGEYMSGTPCYMPQLLSDGSLMDVHYPPSEWKYKVSSRKSNLQHYYTIIIEKLTAVHPHNFVRIAEDIGKKESIKTGDKVKVVTPQGEQSGIAFVTNGVVSGEISIEHGFGHDEYGARAHYIDGVKLLELDSSKAGINHNKLGLLDPTRKGSFSLADFYVGTCVRQSLPARIYKV